MAELPSGTVTFLFTDLEGSTRLWEDYPEAMQDALAFHDELVRDAIVSHAGHVVKTTGDGFHAVFATAHEGVVAAVAAQRALHDAAWPDGLGLRVRMGLHSGEATERDGDWFGSEVNRAARVTAVAHGGQIVCTGVVGTQVRERVGLVDLGEHRLRDLQSEVHLFQVDVPGLAATFPPLRSLDAYRSNLPYELSTFVGREDALRSIADRMRSSRVVSIVGVGGVGKTRLALQVGSELLPHYADGVWLCELAQVLNAEDLPDAVAAAVGYTPPQGVSVVDGLPRFLERKDLLLVLDNCEHLVGAVSSFVTATTAHAAHVSILATSREALGVQGEHISPLASLDVPAAADAVSVLASEAGALFVARASEARGELSLDDATARAVHDLCLRLDGIPLAIELAAAQTKVMTAGEIVTRLDKQFRLLTGARRTSLERHQTLRAAIDWSYDLLGDDERALLDRLSVCVGGFDLDAVAAIARRIGADEFDAFELLGSLVAKSLIERNERDGVTRYRMLEMIRQYAAEQLDATNAADDTRNDHARHYLDLAVSLFHDARTERDYDALDRLEVETPNVASAARWLLANERFSELTTFFADLPYIDSFTLPTTTLDELATVAGELIHQPHVAAGRGLANACFIAGVRAFIDGDIVRYRQLGEITGRFTDDELAVIRFIVESVVVMFEGDLERAMTCAALAGEHARHRGDAALLAWTLSHQVTMEMGYGNSSAGLARADEALAVAHRTGSHIARLYPLLAVVVAAETEDPARALDAADELLRIDATRRRWWSSVVRTTAVNIRCRQGDLAQGVREWRKVFRECHDNGERFLLSTSLSTMADTLAPTHVAVAADLAAIAESDAIAPVATFAVKPRLVELGDDQAPAIAAARERAGSMSYDDAIEFVFTTIDQVIADLEAVPDH